jgi:eukaryotic-like serine/threonine-protein kinase
VFLSVGSKLGPYEILAPLGAGGMGEVYKARDTRLGRAVAIKVLPQRLSSSPESRQRFEREARTISQLSHPHICALYDVGREGETEYLVMEYLEGETLAERLVKRALHLDDALRNGIEIADALYKAHRQGIVHRDLKPSNVMLTKSGVKLLDFGLARALPSPGGRGVAGEGLTSLPTQANLTQEGTILGTFQYMAPEQLEGKETDARTDIFAFGAVLYEMATGRKAFSGTSQASLISAIMTGDPQPISSIQPMSPPALDRIVRTCLAKDPEDRFQTAHDVRLQLQWITEGGSQAGVPAVAPRRSRERLAWVLAGAALLAAAVAAYGYLRRAPGEASPVRSFLLPEEKSEFDLTGANPYAVTVSPDGRRVTFAARGPDGKTVLWLRSLDELVAKPIPGTQGATFPFWSPDGRSLAFFAGGKLQKVDISGSPPLAICDAPDGRSGSWNREGVILFSPEATTNIMRVPAGGGAPRPATTLDAARGDTTHRWATFLPDGRHFLYLAGSHSAGAKSGSNAIFVGALDSNEKSLLLQARSNVAYAAGHLLYVREGVLLAQRFDPGSRRLLGDAVPVASGVQYDPGYFRAAFSASDNGVLVYAPGSSSPNSRLYWHDRSGKRVGDAIADPAEYQRLAVAPDGKHIAAQIGDPGTSAGDIWIIDSRGLRARFTFRSPAGNPVWSPDGSRLAYGKFEGKTGSAVCVKPASGGAEEALYHSPSGFVMPAAWSPDGRFLALNVPAGGNSRAGVWILPLAGDRKPYPLLASGFAEEGNAFSPDGRWFLYTSTESGSRELYIVPFPGPGGRWQVSTAGALGGYWRKATEILYLSAGIDLVSVEVHAGASGVELGSPKVLFSASSWAWGEPAPAGEAVLGAEIVATEEKPRIALVTNWSAGLDKK